jgi:hypothetical protein
MLAAVLNSRRAVEVSAFVVRAFVRMRRMLADQRQFAFKLAEVEAKLASHDRSIKVVFDAIRQLMQKPKPETESPKRKIGFQVSDSSAAADARLYTSDTPARRHSRRRGRK